MHQGFAQCASLLAIHAQGNTRVAAGLRRRNSGLFFFKKIVNSVVCEHLQGVWPTQASARVKGELKANPAQSGCGAAHEEERREQRKLRKRKLDYYFIINF